MGRLDGKTCIITGSTGGQGHVAVRLFAAEGARIVASDLSAEPSEVIGQLISDFPDSVTYVGGDLTSEADVQALVRTAVDRYGGVDVLYNNHGVMLGKPFLETDMVDFDRIIDANLRSVFMLSLYAAKEMAGAGGGSIIHVSSVGGIVGFPGMAAYGASKGGVAQLARSMATDLADHNVRVNALCPGVIDTPMPRRYIADAGVDAQAAWEGLEAMHLLKRVGNAEEVVWAAIFLASDEASFITGAVIPVDGGLTAI